MKDDINCTENSSKLICQKSLNSECMNGFKVRVFENNITIFM